MRSAFAAFFVILLAGSAFGQESVSQALASVNEWRAAAEREGADGTLPVELRLERDSRGAGGGGEPFALWDPAGFSRVAAQEAAKPAPPQNPPAQEGAKAAHGPFSIGGRLMVDHTARDTDSPTGTQSLETTLVSLGLSISYFIDSGMEHELGGEATVTLNETWTPSSTSKNTGINGSLFYQYNYPVTEKAKLIVGGGAGWSSNTINGAGADVITIEWTLDLRLGGRFFLTVKISLDFINKLVFGFGHDDTANENHTKTVGYNMVLGVTYFFGE